MPISNPIDWWEDFDGKGAKFNKIIELINAFNSVKSASTTAPPGSPTIGDRYIIPTGATGDWSSNVDDITEWQANENGVERWIFISPSVPMMTFVVDTLTFISYDSSSWNGIPVDSITFNPNYTPDTPLPGYVWYENGVLHVKSSGEATMQVGLETWDFGYNNSGVTIPDGSVVYPLGIVNGLGNARLAKADSLITARHPLAIATVDILNNSSGQVTVFGDVNGIDTSGLSLGDVFLSDTVAGGMTSTPPVHPSVRYLIGFCKVVDANDGVIFVFQDYRDNDNFMNGTVRESMAVVVSESGGVIIASLDRENGGGGDLTMQFSDGITILDCTPAQTKILTAGSSVAIQQNYLYIPQSTKVLTLSPTGFPYAVEHIKVATIGLFDATRTSAAVDNGSFTLQIHNDHQATSNGQGHNAHQGERQRKDEAKWDDGVDDINEPPTGAYLILSASNSHWKSTIGYVYQLHRQTYPAKDQSVSDVVVIKNHDVTAFLRSSNLFTDITKDSLGSTIGLNKYFNLIFWGVQNKTGEHCPIMVNLPGGYYNGLSSATQDVSGYDDLSIPREFNRDTSTAFLICRLTIKMGTTWSLEDYVDLRGTTPSAVSGGGIGGGVSDHGLLTGLTPDDDHPQYAKVSGRAGEVQKLPDQAGTSLQTIGDIIANFPLNVERDYNADYYIPIVGLSTDNNNATKTKAGIMVLLSALGSEIQIGVSDDYTNGLTKFFRFTKDGGLILPIGTEIDEFSTDGTLAGDSDLALPTEKAVKTYVDNPPTKTFTININPLQMIAHTRSDDTYLAPYATDGSEPAEAVWRTNDGGAGVQTFEARGVTCPISAFIPLESGKTTTVTNVTWRLRNDGGGSGENASIYYRDWDDDQAASTISQSDTTIGTAWETVTFATDIEITVDRCVAMGFMPASGWCMVGGAQITYTVA